MKAAKTRHVFSNNGLQWAISGTIYLTLFFFFIWYHDVRGKPFTLFTTEKCTAIASVYCLAMALALGPLSRFWSNFGKFLPYRRTLGMTAAFMSIPHVILVFAYLPVKFPEKYSVDYPLSWFVGHWFTIIMGFLSLVLFLMMALYSFPGGIQKLGQRKWLILQKFAYLVMIMVVLHLLSMGKIPKNWIAWIETRDKPLPPGSFPTMVVCLGALFLKVVDLLVHGDSLALKPDESDAGDGRWPQ
ncbi:ferric reductase-like transmembrane domain-containing protein [Candidatus Hydrogenedentota bacterium]